MARKKKSSASKKPANTVKKRTQTPKVAAQVAPEVVAGQAIKTEAKKAKRTPDVPAAEAMPVRERRTLSLVEKLAITAGGLLFIVGVVGLLQRPAPDVPVADVKQQSIPMTLEDFKDDPAVQSAIQKQLGGQGTTAPAPQQQTQSPQTADGSLQAPANGNLQAQ